MKLLFINACIRGDNSRTYQLCQDYIEKFISSKNEQWQIEEVNLNSLDIQPLDKQQLIKRDISVKNNDFNGAEFNLAKQLIEADHILVGTPYWDLSFPAKLKIYLERCAVTGLTFIYSPEGIPIGQCKAKSLSYITTSGGPIGNFNFGYDYIQGIAVLFGIKKAYFISAEGLDIIGKDVPKTLAIAKNKISNTIAEINSVK